MILTVFLLFFFSLSTLNKEIIIIILRFYKDKYTVSSQPQSHLEMWEWGTSVRRKKGSIFILHLFCSLWHNFEEQMIELPKFLVQFKHNTVFQCCKLLLAYRFQFYMCLTILLREFLQNMVSTQTYNQTSQTRISGVAVRCSKE